MTTPEKYGVVTGAKSTAAKYNQLFDTMLSLGVKEVEDKFGKKFTITNPIPLYPHYVPKSTIDLTLNAVRKKIRRFREDTAKLGQSELGDVAQYQVRAEMKDKHWLFWVIILPSPNAQYKIDMEHHKQEYENNVNSSSS